MFAMKFEYFSNYDDFPLTIHYGKHDSDLLPHTHEHYSELVFVLSGSATHIVDDEEYVVEKGDVFVLGGNTHHAYINPKDFNICNIMFKPEQIFNRKFDVEKTVGFEALFIVEPKMIENKVFNSWFRLGYKDFQFITDFIADMIDEYESKKDGWRTLVMSDFLRLTVILSRLYSQSPATQSSSSYYLANVTSYINNNYNKDLKVKELASMANLSERHFLRTFKDTYKKSPSDYINSLRLSHAKNLLRHTDLSILAISLQSGFNSSNYFSRQFGKEFGMTPTQYRKANGVV